MATAGAVRRNVFSPLDFLNGVAHQFINFSRRRFVSPLALLLSELPPQRGSVLSCL
jgi:hypothetical protein